MAGFQPIDATVKKIVVGLSLGAAGLAIQLVGDAPFPVGLTTAVIFGALSFAAAEIIEFKKEHERFRTEVRDSIGRLETAVRQEGTADREATATAVAALARATGLVSGRQRLAALDEMVLDLTEAIRTIDESVPPLAHALVVEHLLRAIQCAGGPRTGEIVYPGEDRLMLLALAAAARTSIDAVSPLIIDSREFWLSEFGLRYLEIQRGIIADRSVQVRRLFVLDHRGQISDDAVLQHIAEHEALGIRTRVLAPEDAPSTLRRTLTNFTVFDDCLSYEMTSSMPFAGPAGPLPTQTTVIFAAETVSTRRAEFDRLWEVAVRVEGTARTTDQ